MHVVQTATSPQEKAAAQTAAAISAERIAKLDPNDTTAKAVVALFAGRLDEAAVILQTDSSSSSGASSGTSSIIDLTVLRTWTSHAQSKRPPTSTIPTAPQADLSTPIGHFLFSHSTRKKFPGEINKPPDETFRKELGFSCVQAALRSSTQLAVSKEISKTTATPTDKEKHKIDTWFSSLGEKTQGASTLVEIENIFCDRGLRRGTDKHGKGIFTDGTLQIHISPFTMAETPSYKIEVVRADGATTIGQQVHVGSLVFSQKEWQLFEKSYQKTLDQYRRRLPQLLHGKAPPKTAWAVRAFLKAGAPPEKLALTKKQIEELRNKQNEFDRYLLELKSKGQQPKNVIDGDKGPDAASKTSNALRAGAAFKRFGYTEVVESFKNRTESEKNEGLLLRYARKAPQLFPSNMSGSHKGDLAQAFIIFIHDRTLAGDFAYSSMSLEQMKTFAAEAAAWVKEQEKNGTFVCFVLYDPRIVDGESPSDEDVVLERPMKTFGKREARAVVARELLAMFGGELSPEEYASLKTATMGPGFNDMKSFHEGNEVMKRFYQFAEEMGGWIVVGTKDRHKGRLAAIDKRLQKLKAWAAEYKKA